MLKKENESLRQETDSVKNDLDKENDVQRLDLIKKDEEFEGVKKDLKEIQLNLEDATNKTITLTERLTKLEKENLELRKITRAKQYVIDDGVKLIEGLADII